MAFPMLLAGPPRTAARLTPNTPATKHVAGGAAARPVFTARRSLRSTRDIRLAANKKKEEPVVFSANDLSGSSAPSDPLTDADGEVEIVIINGDEGEDKVEDKVAAAVDEMVGAAEEAAEELEGEVEKLEEEARKAAAQLEEEVARTAAEMEQAAADLEAGVAQAAEDLESGITGAAANLEAGVQAAAQDLESGVTEAAAEMEAGVASAFEALADAVGANTGARAGGGGGEAAGAAAGGWEGGGVGGVGWESMSREEVKGKVLARAAATSRGQAASTAALGEIMGLISGLETKNPTPAPTEDGALDGTWVLCFSSVQVIRSSPFFRAFKEVVGPKLAEDIYAFTDALPGVTKGEAIQIIDSYSGKLDSKVDLKIVPFPYLEADGKMVTKSTFDAVSLDTISVTVETTQVTDNTLPGFDQIVFPMRQAFDLVRAEGVPVSIRTSYLDDDLRVARYDDGSVFVYTRR